MNSEVSSVPYVATPLPERTRIAAQIMAGFAANPAIFASNERCGWCLVNATDEELTGYAVKLADHIIEATK